MNLLRTLAVVAVFAIATVFPAPALAQKAEAAFTVDLERSCINSIEFNALGRVASFEGGACKDSLGGTVTFNRDPVQDFVTGAELEFERGVDKVVDKLGAHLNKRFPGLKFKVTGKN